MNRRTISSICMFLIAAAVAIPSPAAAPQSHVTVVAPATPDGPRRVQFLPDRASLVDRDAAPLYLIACILLAQQGELANRASLLLETPTEKLDRSAADSLLKEASQVLDLLHAAGRRRFCHWDSGEDQFGFGTLLPQLAGLRRCAPLLALEARLAIADKRWDDAQNALQSIFAMADHVSRDGYLIQLLVGASIQSTGLARVQQWITTPDSPGVYWALAKLSRPSSRISGAIAFERKLILDSLKLPVDERDINAQSWSAALGSIRKLYNDPQHQGAIPADAALVATLLPRARAYLLSSGVTENQLRDSVPAAIVLRYCVAEMNELMDTAMAATALPAPVAIKALEKVSERFSQVKTQIPPNPLLLVVPAFVNTYKSSVSADRSIAVLQLHEAIRDHVRRTGKLPAKHEEITELPVPLDPVTLQPFPFERADNAVRFSMIHLSAASTLDTYEIRTGK